MWFGLCDTKSQKTKKKRKRVAWKSVVQGLGFDTGVVVHGKRRREAQKARATLCALIDAYGVTSRAEALAKPLEAFQM
jgi:hypothetical protein